jgi:putative ABC transport system permease protein
MSSKEGSRGSTGARRQRVAGVLVVTEVALTQIVDRGGLMIKSFYALQEVNPGFTADSVLTMQVTLPPLKYAEDTQIMAFYEQALERIETLPGVQAAAAATTLPMTGSLIMRRFTIDGRAPAAPNERLSAHYAAISPEYFRAMGIRLIDGRGFTDHDRDNSQQVIIITRLCDVCSGRTKIRSASISITAEAGVWREIVGVVADVKQSSLDAEAGLEVYEPYLQFPWNFMAIVVRTAADPLRMAPSVRNEILAVDKAQPVYDVKSTAEIMDDSVSQPRLYVVAWSSRDRVLGVGIYGVMNYSVNQRSTR